MRKKKLRVTSVGMKTRVAVRRNTSTAVLKTQGMTTACGVSAFVQINFRGIYFYTWGKKKPFLLAYACLNTLIQFLALLIKSVSSDKVGELRVSRIRFQDVRSVQHNVHFCARECVCCMSRSASIEKKKAKFILKGRLLCLSDANRQWMLFEAHFISFLKV